MRTTFLLIRIRVRCLHSVIFLLVIFLKPNLNPSWFFSLVDDSDSEPSDDEGGTKGVGEAEVPPTGADEEEKKRLVLPQI